MNKQSSKKQKNLCAHHTQTQKNHSVILKSNSSANVLYKNQRYSRPEAISLPILITSDKT